MASEPEALIFHDVVRQRPGTMGKSVPRDDALPPDSVHGGLPDAVDP